MKRFIIAVVAVTLAACAGGDPANNGDTNGDTNAEPNNDNNSGGCVDLDGDGFDGRTPGCPSGNDCDDASTQINPAQLESGATCSDRRDNDCDGLTDSDDSDCGSANECMDADGDRYGVGAGCFGPDCNDDPAMNGAAVNPGATEICGDGIDQDCVNGDQPCPENCIDMDGDGYGAEGSTDCVDDDGMVLAEVDCNDDPAMNGAAINVTADEICDGLDNNCNDMIDECPLPGQACTGTDPATDTCQGGASAQCENADDCAGQFLTCDTSQDPKVCRVAEGGPCQDVADCVDGLECNNNVCEGNFCASDPCDAASIYAVCDRAAGLCVECPHFDPDEATRDAPCGFGQSCVPGGWCAFRDPICTDFSTDTFCDEAEIGNPGALPFGAPTDITAAAELWWINWYMADCWLRVRPDGTKRMCSSFRVAADAGTIQENATKDAYTDDHLTTPDGLTQEEDEALDDIWGVGLFDAKEIDWKANLVAGTDGDVCLWYQPGGFFGGESLVLDKCENFSP